MNNSLGNLRLKYNKYENFTDMFRKIIKHTFNKEYNYLLNKPNQIINKTNLSLDGGDINSIIEKYSDIINIQIDTANQTNGETELLFISINSQITCGVVILDNIRKVATIHDLISDISCLKKSVSKSVMEEILKIIKNICKKSGMIYIELSDTSQHTCKGTQINYKLNIGNTLTTGMPYYYKYGFEYIDKENHANVLSNYEILSNTKTEKIDKEDLEVMIKYKLKNKGKDKIYIKEVINKINDIYTKNNGKNITRFINDIKYENCEVFAIIYHDLYKMLDLGYYSNSNKLMRFTLYKNKK